MFYDSESTESPVQQAVEQIIEASREEALENNEPITIGPTSDSQSIEHDEELMALIDEAIALAEAAHEQCASADATAATCEAFVESDPFAELLAELNAYKDESELAALPDPFAELFSEIEKAQEVCEAPGATESTCTEYLAKDPFAELLAEIEAAEQEVSYPNPFEELLASMQVSGNETLEPTKEQVSELAEELAEEVVAEAIQNADQASKDDGEEVPAEESMDSNAKLALARRALIQARDTLSSVIEILNGQMLEQNGAEVQANELLKRALHSVGARVLEGVFDGERMIAGDGSVFPVPPNYASKSKLVEGDMLKLTVMPDGKMIYKQIGPTARDRVKGVLSCDERGGYCVLSGGARYKVIPASVSFHRGRPGDNVVALVPKGSPSKFAAVDFIVHQ